MRIRSLLALAGTVLALCASNTFAATDVAAKQAEIRKAVAAALDKFYKARPALKADVHAAPGYAVFTTYGLSFVVGGGGGTIGAGAGGKSAGGGEGEQFVNDALYYTYTKTGLEVGGLVAGTKFYKEKDLN